MVSGGYFSFEFEVIELFGTPWIVLSVYTSKGDKFGCKWELDANGFQVGAALKSLSEFLCQLENQSQTEYPHEE